MGADPHGSLTGVTPGPHRCLTGPPGRDGEPFDGCKLRVARNLERWIKLRLPVHPRNLILAGCRASSLSIKQTLDHSAISNHFAHNKHEGETASWAGNSLNVIQRHYKALVKEADAKELWEIAPDNVAHTIQFPVAAAAQ